MIIIRYWREYALVKLRLIFNPAHLFYRRSESKGESIEFKFIKKKKIDKFEEDDFSGLLEIFKSVFFGINPPFANARIVKTKRMSL